MICSLDLHDGSILRNRWDLLLRLKEHIPGIKLSLFYIPYDWEAEVVDMLRVRRGELLQTLKDNLDWIELIPHGLSHLPKEFVACDRRTMNMALEAYQKVEEQDGLKLVHGFCAPYWLYTQAVADVLDENDWWIAVDRNQPNLPRTKKYYQYNYSISEPFWLARSEVLKLHGHMDRPSVNNLEDCLLNLFKLPPNVEWRFASEMLSDR